MTFENERSRDGRSPKMNVGTQSPHQSQNVIPHLMRDLFFMNAVTEMHSMLFLNDWAFV
jgi:hypothetical protein